MSNNDGNQSKSQCNDGVVPTPPPRSPKPSSSNESKQGKKK